jgi:hypothetical protein
MAQISPQFRFHLIVDTVIDPDARLQLQLFQTRCWDIALDAFTAVHETTLFRVHQESYGS